MLQCNCLGLHKRLLLLHCCRCSLSLACMLAQCSCCRSIFFLLCIACQPCTDRMLLFGMRRCSNSHLSLANRCNSTLLLLHPRCTGHSGKAHCTARHWRTAGLSRNPHLCCRLVFCSIQCSIFLLKGIEIQSSRFCRMPCSCRRSQRLPHRRFSIRLGSLALKKQQCFSFRRKGSGFGTAAGKSMCQSRCQ